ncbi:MAG: hypothetical protein GF334_13305 [Candidatus Altiarchaeales archaeon]|nr:hypothetical protein [Candidatus Altiarchaeales archaeon]
MAAVVYVDSLYGNDSNSGTVLYPVRTLTQAYTLASSGTVIVLQEGDGTSYGSLTIQKDLTIRRAYNTTPQVDTLTIVGAQCLIEGLAFDNLSEGVVVSNSSLGAVSVKECRFTDVSTAIQLNNANYISIHRNYIKNHDYGVLINNAVEVTLSSNIFDDGRRSIEVITVDRLDLWRNTIYGGSGSSPVENPDENLRVIYHTVTASNISNKRIQLPTFAAQNSYGYDVAVNVVNGPSFPYGTDYTVISDGSIVSWDGLGLDGQVQVGDLLRIMYSEAADPQGAEAIRALGVNDPDSTIDSNNITGTTLSNIELGVFINQQLRMRYNNFYRTNVWYSGPLSDDTKNFSDDPLYTDPTNGDFRIPAGSPDVNAGDPTRWDKILTDMDLGNRENVAPFNREIDYTGVHRYALGPSGDVGAFEYNVNEGSAGTYVGEDGYDFAYPGSETAPYATIDRGFNRAGSSDLSVEANAVPVVGGVTGPFTVPTTGSEVVRYGRYPSEDLMLGSGKINVGQSQDGDVAFVRSSYPRFETGVVYVSPDGSDTTGTGSYTGPYRTIQRALSDSAPFVLVRPGYYPSFKGDSSKTLIGIEETKTISLGSTYFVNMLNGGWTGPAGYTVTRSTVVLTDTSSAMGLFTFLGDYEVKYSATVSSDTMKGTVVNADNQVYVELDRSSQKMTVGYRTDGSYYDFDYDLSSLPITGALTNVRTTTTLTDNRARVRVKNSYINEDVQFDLGAGYTGPWTLMFESTGSGQSKAQDISVSSSQFSGATGVNQTVTQHKIFGIMGATGFQGFSGIK